MKAIGKRDCLVAITKIAYRKLLTYTIVNFQMGKKKVCEQCVDTFLKGIVSHEILEY
jgi:hypothetical protein